MSVLTKSISIKPFVLKLCLSIFCLFCALHAQAQYDTLVVKGNGLLLLNETKVQIESAKMLDDIYDFKFEDVDREYIHLKEKYGWHPLPYFLRGLAEWWKITVNFEDKSQDPVFQAYMDTSIVYARKLYEYERTSLEGAFFLSAAYAFEARLLSERKEWTKAANIAKQALNYLEICKGKGGMSPELLFGDGLYNYYAEWIPENYAMLKPIMWFFPKGDKDLGIRQLTEVTQTAFFTRTEGQIFLMRMLAGDGKDLQRATQISEYLHKTYQDNPYFERYLARMLYSTARYDQMEEVCFSILNKIEQKKYGYSADDGRYAAFFLGQLYHARMMYVESEKYYQMTVNFVKQNEAYDMGYFHYALLGLMDISGKQGDYSKAKEYYKQLKKYAKRGDAVSKAARMRIKRYKKMAKK
ncbi:tol-pal system protein YbgF [Persicobacter psychrovividus]|uniref:Tol-pal system protein YbgF n=1 Tax=Persicobacter psychrovividus TaxID=387638 RepID=A0ABN6L5W6_9BACT|nr:hypothetical protein PEPS_04590 [Persicobacter psychrovividus]